MAQELSHEVAVTMSAGAAAHSHGWQAVPGQWHKGQSLPADVSIGLLGCPHNMAADSPQSKGSERRQGQMPECRPCPRRSSHQCHFPISCWCSGSALFHSGGNYPRAMNPKGGGHCRTCWGLAPTTGEYYDIYSAYYPLDHRAIVTLRHMKATERVHD